MTDQIVQVFILRQDRVLLSSLNVAEYFEKDHFHVLRDIENLEVSQRFRASNFGVSDYKSKQGKKMPCVEMTRDGFMMLAMGFNGRKAMEWKEKLIDAFNAMEKVIREQIVDKDNELWKLIRRQGKRVRVEETDVIKEFIDYAIFQGSKNAERYYVNITKMENKALFLLEQALPDKTNLRNLMNIMQLTHIKEADFLVAKALKEGMNKKMYYKDIYPFAKEKVEAFAAVVGASHIGETMQEMIAGPAQRELKQLK